MIEDKLFTSVLDESQRCGDDEGLVDTILFSRGRIQDFDKFKAPTSKSPPTNPKPPTNSNRHPQTGINNSNNEIQDANKK